MLMEGVDVSSVLTTIAVVAVGIIGFLGTIAGLVAKSKAGEDAGVHIGPNHP